MARKTVVRHKDIIISSSLAALIIAVVVLVQITLILPVTSAAKQHEKKSVEAVKKLEENTRKRRQAEELEHKNARMRAQLALFDRRVPAKGTVGAVFADVLRSASLHKLRVVKTEPQEPVAAGQGFYQFPFTLDVVGGYHELGRFISELESDTSFMQIADADLNADPDGPVRARLMLVLYGVDEGWLGGAGGGAAAPLVPASLAPPPPAAAPPRTSAPAQPGS
jgi:Tfp pilus assembly protein PilO